MRRNPIAEDAVPNTLLLTQSHVRALLTMAHAVDAVEAAFAAHGRGEALMPAKVYLELEAHDGDFRAMPSYLAGAAGVKWVNSHPRNPERHGLPAVMGLYVLSDPASAAPLAILDATLLTALRTGAAAGVASRHLAAGPPATLGLVGCGVQARYLLEAHRVVFPAGFEVLVADARPEAARALAQAEGGRAVTVEEASACDIVCTSTPTRSPIVRRPWLAARAHVNAMGADAPGKQELDPGILDDAAVFIDDAHQAFSSGEVNVPLRTGRMKEENIQGTLGDVIVGAHPGRGDHAITVFDSTGLAIQDLALASLAHELARAAGLGAEIDWAS